MKAGEIWISKGTVDLTVHQYIILIQYMKQDFWYVSVYMSDEDEDCATEMIMSGREIHEHYTKVNDA
jgi:hypothetical protein